MKTKLLLSAVLSINFCLLFSQVPQGFNYQAVATDGSGAQIKNTTLQVKIAILSNLVPGTVLWEELHSTVQTNAYGLFTLIIGSGVRQSGLSNFYDLDWTSSPLYLKTQIYYQSEWKDMGSTQLYTVPYAMVADDLSGTLRKLAVTGETTSMEEALFEVKNKDGQTIFAVYNEGVRVYVSDGDTKGVKGGFAIGGFDNTKGTIQEYFVVNSDSIRAYIDDTGTGKGVKGGFAIGGFDNTKALTQDYLKVSPDSIRLYVDNNPTVKGVKGGFAIGGFDNTKGTKQDLLTVSSDSTRIYIDNTPTKGVKGGFAIGGFDNTKGNVNPFTSLTPDNYFIGHNSGVMNTIGKHNSVLGFESAYNNTEGNDNVFLGFQAGYWNQTGSNNVAVGNLSGYSGTYVNSNVSLGDSAGYGNTSSYNVFIGKGSGKVNAGQFSTFIGYQSGSKNNTGPNNVFIGYKTGYNNTTGGFNTFIGKTAGYKNMSGWSNVFIGDQAGFSNIGSNNICIGESSGYSLKEGRYNLLIGDWSGKWNTDGNNNIFLGAMSGQDNNGSSNIMIGYLCGMNSAIGSDNILIGKSTGRYSSGSNNIFIGSGAGSNSSGSNNLFIGTSAGSIETGSDKLIINNSEAGMPLIIGDFFNDRIGINRMPTTYTLEVGGTIWANGSTIVAGVATWSDSRYKTDITPLTDALPDILKIQGIRYNWRLSEYPELNFPEGEQIGIIAQDLEKILPELVYTDPDGYKSVSYEKLTPVLIEAIKEQQKQIESAIQDNQQLKSELDVLKVLVNSLVINQTALMNK